jgi:hypothetical protein
VALVASLGLLHPQILSLEAVPFKGRRSIKTTDFARPAELSPCPTHDHHWFANAESYFLIGEAAGEGMKSLLQ